MYEKIPVEVTVAVLYMDGTWKKGKVVLHIQDLNMDENEKQAYEGAVRLVDRRLHETTQETVIIVPLNWERI